MEYYELEPEQNTFYVISADITHKCNMTCANCYVPNRTIPDMDLERFYDLIRRLPNRCEIRLLGGEPTLHPQLPEIIRKVRELGQRPVIVTNGLKLADVKYVETLRESGLASVCLSFNGVDMDEWYLKTDGMRCASAKLAALENCYREKMFVALGCIIQKGVNEMAPSRLLNVISKHPRNNFVLRFKNVGQMGRYSQSQEESVTYDELIKLVCDQLDVSEEFARNHNIVSGFQEENTILFPVENPNTRSGKIMVKITNWTPHANKKNFIDPGSRRRGRITKDFKIAPFSEHVRLNENGY